MFQMKLFLQLENKLYVTNQLNLEDWNNVYFKALSLKVVQNRVLQQTLQPYILAMASHWFLGGEGKWIPAHFTEYTIHLK